MAENSNDPRREPRGDQSYKHIEWLQKGYRGEYYAIRSGQLGEDEYVSGRVAERVMLEDQNQLDTLTGLLNKRGISETLEKVVVRERSHGRPVGAIIFDIDNFKLGINDTLGHVVGNKVLREMGILLREVAENGWEMARFGGEEFMLVLPGVSGRGLVEAANLIGNKISESLAARVGNPELPMVTVSLGAGIVRVSEGFEDLENRVDQLMYKAKRADPDGTSGRQRGFVQLGNGDLVMVDFGRKV